MTLNHKQLKLPKDFTSNVNRARMQLTFHKGKHTIASICEVLGLNVPRKYEPTQIADTATFNRITKTYERWYQRNQNWTLPGKKTVKESPTSNPVLNQSEEVQCEDPIEEDFRPDRNPKQRCTLMPFQAKVESNIWRDFVRSGRTGVLIPMKVGYGKTYTYGQFIRDAYDSGWIAKHKRFAPFPVVIATKSSIVEQTCRVMEEDFGLKVPSEVMVVNYEMLRSKFGEMFIDEETVVENGEPTVKYTWRPFLNPVVLVLDEYHSVKNLDSAQSKICQAFNDIPVKEKIIISSSATPFSKVSSAKVFAVSTGHKWKNLDRELTLTNENWPAFSKHIAYPASPDEFNKAAIKRLLKEMRPYIYAPKNVRPKHKSINNVVVIDFETQKDQDDYNIAWEKYLEEKAKIEGGAAEGKGIYQLVMFQKFRQAAELIKAPYIARRMFDSNRLGMAPIAAFNFKPSIAKALLTLHRDFRVQRDRICLVWGGDARLSSAERISPEEMQQIMSRASEGEDVDLKMLRKILAQLQFDNMGLANLPRELELGVQNKDKRQEEIDRFQSGYGQYCMFTFGAGGAGLSLHNCTPKTKQRRGYHSSTYNEMEAEQALGRGHRINSITDTEQSILVFRNTIEQKVLGRMFTKKGCLDIVMKHTDESVYHDREAEDVLKITADGEEETIREDEIEEMVNARD